MANPSKAELFTQLANACKIRNLIFVHGASFLTLQDVLIQSTEGVQSASVLSFLQTQRSVLLNYLTGSRAYILVLVKEILKVGYAVNTGGLSERQIFRRLQKEMADASETIKSIELTRGSISAGGSNVGEALVYRTNLDEHGYSIEYTRVGAVKIECIQDKNFPGILAGKELFRVYGNGITEVDNVELNATTSASLNMNIDPVGILVNPDFSQITSSISTVEQPGWRLSATASFSKVTETTTPNDIYRYAQNAQSQNSPTGSAIRFVADGSIAQYVSKSNKKILSDVPYFLVCRWMRKSSCDGTLTLSLGSQSEDATVSSATNDIWNNLVVGSATKKGWLSVFDQDWEDTTKSPTLTLGVQIKAALASRTTGELIIGEILMIPGKEFNGSYLCIVPGKANKDALLGDEYTYTDSYTTGGTYQGVIQETIGKELGFHLPHVNTSETFSDA